MLPVMKTVIYSLQNPHLTFESSVRFFLPWPSAFDIHHERPAQESTHYHQEPEYGDAFQCPAQYDGVNNISGNEYFQPEQEGLADIVSKGREASLALPGKKKFPCGQKYSNDYD